VWRETEGEGEREWEGGRGGIGGSGHLVRLRGPFVVFLLGFGALAGAPSPLGRGHCPCQGSGRLQEQPLGPVDKERGVRHRGNLICH